MLIKRRPPQLTGFVENKYRHEHVMITNLYILSHILYDRHLYECILLAFCACLKEAWGCTHLRLVECTVTLQPASFPIWEMWRLGSDTIMYPPVQVIHDWSIRDCLGPGRPVKGYDMTIFQTVPCHIARMSALSCWKRKLFPTVW